MVLLFFPLAFSSVCMDEMCQVAASYDRYEKLDAQVLGLSVDSPFVNRKFAAECGARFPILSDFNRQVAQKYDVMYDDFHGLEKVAKRSAFVVDREGKIAYAWVSEDAGVMPDFDRILEAVERVTSAR